MTQAIDPSEATPPSGSQPSATLTGASVNPIYTRRNMTMYALTESEITTISQLNTDVSLHFSIASFLLSMALGVYTNALFYDKLNSAGSLAQGFAAPLVLLLGMVFAIRGLFGLKRRSDLWSKLKTESAIEPG
jgi:hypothetical protein